MSHGPGLGAAVTVSPWLTFWAPDPAAARPGEERVSHCQEVSAAVTVSPWLTLWAGESESGPGICTAVTVSPWPTLGTRACPTACEEERVMVGKKAQPSPSQLAFGRHCGQERASQVLGRCSRHS